MSSPLLPKGVKMIAVWDVYLGDSTESVAGKYRTPVVVATIALNMATNPTVNDAYLSSGGPNFKLQTMASNTNTAGRSTAEKARIAAVWGGSTLTRSTTYPGIYNVIVDEPNGVNFLKLSGVEAARVYC